MTANLMPATSPLGLGQGELPSVEDRPEGTLPTATQRSCRSEPSWADQHDDCADGGGYPGLDVVPRSCMALSTTTVD